MTLLNQSPNLVGDRHRRRVARRPGVRADALGLRADGAVGGRAGERASYELRVRSREPYPTRDDYLDATRAAMAITCRAYGARLDALISERVAEDRFARDAERAHGMLAAALAPGLRVVR
jgi:hypothetical protein